MPLSEWKRGTGERALHKEAEMMNEFLAWELTKEKMADAERAAEKARLAASVAGPDPMVRIGTILVLAITAALLWLIF
jgi:hypothetical protein